MNDEIAVFIVVMTSVVAVAVLMLTWMRSRLRLAEIRAGRGEKLESAREMALLSDENAGLKTMVGRLEERLAVLERIATDPAERTAREIESLR
jgi:hypothetical protein